MRRWIQQFLVYTALILLIICILVSLSTAPSTPPCQGQCTHDRACQERCLRARDCPYAP